MKRSRFSEAQIIGILDLPPKNWAIQKESLFS